MGIRSVGDGMVMRMIVVIMRLNILRVQVAADNNMRLNVTMKNL